MFYPSSFTPEQRRMVYSNVKEEIAYHTEQGEHHYSQGYYSEAVNDFEKVNFYEERTVIPLSRIKQITEKAEEKSKFYYERGMKALNSNNKQALIEFNRMMRCDPTYKDGKAQYEHLKKNKEIAALLATLKSDLGTNLKKNLQNTSALKSLNQSLDTLALYDDSNPLVIKSKELAETYRKIHLKKAIAFYKNQKYDDASEKFESLLQIYPQEPTAQKYLSQIVTKQEGQKKIKLARNALEQKDYRLAMKYASKGLETYPSNKEWQNVYDVAAKEYELTIPERIAKGIECYNKQELDNALALFQSVLETDSNNTISVVYIKKIKQQLQTIKSLR